MAGSTRRRASSRRSSHSSAPVRMRFSRTSRWRLRAGSPSGRSSLLLFHQRGDLVEGEARVVVAAGPIAPLIRREHRQSNVSLLAVDEKLGVARKLTAIG